MNAERKERRKTAAIERGNSIGKARAAYKLAVSEAQARRNAAIREAHATYDRAVSEVTP